MNKRKSITAYFILAITGAFFAGCLISSCGKTTVLPAGSNIEYQVMNLSPDLLAVDLYIDFGKKNTASFYYPTPSGYFSVTSIDTPYQIRPSTTNLLTNTTTVSNTTIFSIDTILKNNVKYTLFITGLLATNSITYVLTRDTAATPTAGRGKIRFINVSPGSGGLDISANGTLAFTNQAYKTISKFIEVPPGNYDFRAYPTGTTTTILSDLPSITVQDGKLYTLYGYGIVNRTDSARFAMGIIQNN